MSLEEDAINLHEQLISDYIIPEVDDPRIIHIVTDTFRNAIQSNTENKTEMYYKQFMITHVSG